jgi:hypothetical protein
MVLPTYPDWRNETTVSCWQCEHFQRYDQASAPVECWGECRKNNPAPLATLDGFSFQSAPDPVITMPGFLVLGFSPFVPYANQSWCSGFQRAVIAPPAAPANIGACASQFPPINPAIFNVSTSPLPWSIKPITASCWYCQHFQRFYQSQPAAPYPADMCAGSCCHEPPGKFTMSEQTAFPFEYPYQNPWFPIIIYGALFWCSKWEKTSQARPAPYTGIAGAICDSGGQEPPPPP